MKPFQFRAEAALQVRRRQEDDARIVLTRAENEARVAEHRLADAQRALLADRERLVSLQSDGVPAWRIEWHRSWIVSQQQRVEACRRDLAVAAAAVARAHAAVREAYRKRRTLERLKDRAWRRYQVEAQRHDIREMSALAGMRHLVQAREGGASSADHEQRDDGGQRVPRHDEHH